MKLFKANEQLLEHSKSFWDLMIYYPSKSLGIAFGARPLMHLPCYIHRPSGCRVLSASVHLEFADLNKQFDVLVFLSETWTPGSKIQCLPQPPTLEFADLSKQYDVLVF